MENAFRTVPSLGPPAPYIGGKRRLARHLVERIEAVPHDAYLEPFVGMGGVFLRRRLAPRVEVINDVSGDVATFFRILQRHYVPFMDMLRFQLTSRSDFERLLATDAGTLTDLERAARFLYLQRLTFGGKVAGRSFGIDPATPGRFDVVKLADLLAALAERLSGVVIECLPYAEMIDRYDRPGALFYLDPPYSGSEAAYGTGVFAPADFSRLAERLARIRGRFLLSIDDTPEMRATFGAFDQEIVELVYSVGGGTGTLVRELVVSSPGLPAPARRQGTLF